jgi:hypothetical protein
MCSQWYYYVKQRDKSEEWKCQPHTWLSPELERHEILLGSLSLLVTSFISAVITCYVRNGGWSTIYYEFDEYTWIWWFLQWPVIFIYQVRNYIKGVENRFVVRFQSDKHVWALSLSLSIYIYIYIYICMYVDISLPLTQIIFKRKYKVLVFSRCVLLMDRQTIFGH